MLITHIVPYSVDFLILLFHSCSKYYTVIPIHSKVDIQEGRARGRGAIVAVESREIEPYGEMLPYMNPVLLSHLLQILHNVSISWLYGKKSKWGTASDNSIV